jgi:two-component system, OmpR family, sensor kinase
MTRWTKLPIRVRLTLMFAIGIAAVLGAVGVFVYVRTGADLLDANDAGLRSRAEVLAAGIRANGPSLTDVGSTLIEPDEAFAQVADASGAIQQSSPIVKDMPLLPPATIRSLSHPEFFDRHIAGIDNVSRVLAVPVQTDQGRSVVLVGPSLQDRRDELLQLAATLAIGGPIALLVISWAGWALVGAALRPVQRMQRESASISTTEEHRRLSLPAADDEISRLGTTLNAMLDRIQESFERERRFVDNASHELRTPVGILKAELDLSLRRARTRDELHAALVSASEEADHLVRLAEDMLVMSRANGGRLPVRRTPTSLPALLQEQALRFGPRAAEAGVRMQVSADQEELRIDPVRVRQALDGLLENALRYTPAGGTISLWGARQDGLVRLGVLDSGPGFRSEFLPHALEPFSRRVTDARDGAGLGLAIVRAIAEAHGGTAEAANGPQGGASVTMVFPDAW